MPGVKAAGTLLVIVRLPDCVGLSVKEFAENDVVQAGSVEPRSNVLAGQPVESLLVIVAV